MYQMARWVDNLRVSSHLSKGPEVARSRWSGQRSSIERNSCTN